MSTESNYRKERVERLLHELRYEITRGMMEGDLDEDLGFIFSVPISKKMPNGIVACEFRTRPMPNGYMDIDEHQPRLKVVK